MAKEKRIAVIDRELCDPKSCGFYLCQRVCPVNRSGEECITVWEDDKKPLIDEMKCIGCGICVKKCPKMAIKVVNLPKALDEEPVHRYGRNGFSLFRLPVPKNSSVVGLIGPNGVGKSTVMRIMSGELKPDSGRGKAGWEEILDRFKGTEIQNYLERLARGEIRGVHKPQHVDLIQKKVRGRVGEILLKSGSRERVLEAVEGLGIGYLMDKDVSSLSGGELQLFAVAGALSKEAEFFFFDEPSSYLDVEQRMRVANEIRKKAEEAVVVVIEHDLAVADYLADYTHILYGEPGAFGVVSPPYGVRTGINAFLEGYIREENMRFRPEQISFSYTARKAGAREKLGEFPALRKSFKGFEMESGPGVVRKAEVIGIIGPNGTGKTTFMRMLAGELEPDQGSGLGLEMHHKPQRLVIDGDGMETVEEYMRSKNPKAFSQDNKAVVHKLGLDKLMERKIGSLSGGELQSTFLALALTSGKQLILLDEPSAFLDVEQRLRVASLIRKVAEERETSFFVIDHDLQMIDAVSDGVMLFEGQRGTRGHGKEPSSLKEGLNEFLRSLGITFRRDPTTGRPRANKPGSQKDQEQKSGGHFYYSR